MQFNQQKTSTFIEKKTATKAKPKCREAPIQKPQCAIHVSYAEVFLQRRIWVKSLFAFKQYFCFAII